MSSLLQTVRKSDNYQCYYIDGKQVSRATFYDRDAGKGSCFLTIDKGTHWHHRHVGDRE